MSNRKSERESVDVDLETVKKYVVEHIHSEHREIFEINFNAELTFDAELYN